MLARDLRMRPICENYVPRTADGASGATIRNLLPDFPPKLVRRNFAIEERCKRGVAHGRGRKPSAAMSAIGRRHTLANLNKWALHIR